MLKNDEILCNSYDKPKVLHCIHADLQNVMVCFTGIIISTFFSRATR
jgi:hypothetical protein